MHRIDQADAGNKPFAFQIVIEDLIGKSEDAEMMLAADNEELMHEWMSKIESCFTIVDPKKTGSTATAAVVKPIPHVTKTALEPAQTHHGDEDESNEQHHNGGEEGTDDGALAARRARAMAARAKAVSPDGTRQPVAIFKSPKFKNLLNSNGLDEQKQHEEEPPTAAERTSLLRKQKSNDFIFVRPTEQVRMGYLLKQTSKERSEDSWINQYVTLDVTIGLLSFYAEISG